MTIRSLASRIAKLEGRKSQTRIADIREILSLLSDIMYAEPADCSSVLYDNGKKRLKRKKK